MYARQLPPFALRRGFTAELVCYSHPLRVFPLFRLSKIGIIPALLCSSLQCSISKWAASGYSQPESFSIG
jgi:hypothetical protein